MLFDNMNLDPNISRALDEMGFVTPSEIQQKAIPMVLENRDVIGQAQTGTGKTAAFAIPTLQLTDQKSKVIQHLVIAPTRELANQIATEYVKIGKYLDISVATIVGGVSYEKQRLELKKKPQILVGTPGRIIDLINKGKIKLSSLRTFTLDEADEMLKQGFLEEIQEIIKSLPENRRNLLFSATLDKRIMALAFDMLKDPVTIQVSKGLTSKTSIKQCYILTKEKTKFNNLTKFLEIDPHQVAVIFGRTKRRVEELSEALKQVGFKARGIQGDMAQKQRDFVMQGFREQKFNILVATDVAARGIDVEGITHVYNFDLPDQFEYYTHRIGRTGRAGKSGVSISFVKDSEVPYLERLIRETKSEPVLIEAPSIAMIREQKLDVLKNDIADMVADDGIMKYVDVAQELILKHGHDALVAALIKDKFDETNPSTLNVSLTGEPGVSDKGGKKSSSGRSRNRSRSRGRNRGEQGGSRNHQNKKRNRR